MNMDTSIFDKILSKKASAEEKEEFFSALRNDEDLKAEYIEYKNLWTIHSLNKDSVPENRREQLFAEFWRRTNRGKAATLNNLLFTVLKYAAVVLVTIGISYLLTDHTDVTPEHPAIREYRTTQGSIATILLSDNSQIWLNANSGMRITEKKNGDIVTTLDGEAYFEINHNETRNFIVDLGKIQIKDIGTSFNVKAYSEDEQIVATLIEGTIDVQNEAGKKLASMTPNEHFRFNKNEDRFTLNSIDTDLVTGWKEGKFVFPELSLREICDELEKWYNVEIVIDPKQNEHEVFSSVMKKSTTIKQVLELLKLTTGMNYRIVEKEGGPDVVFLY
jgi:ferric-dicitrate binding protein FerR (iron transport regulator)